MLTRESDIAFESGAYWVLRMPKAFEVYKNGITHSTRCAFIGYDGAKGLEMAKAEISRRQAKDDLTTV